jgi:hypothetical protein
MSESHTNILALVDLVLCLPSSSAVCEQGFSRMKFTKTDWRNRLKSRNLTDQLVIMLHTSEVGDYNPEDAVIMWHLSGPRKKRLRQYNNKKNKGKVDEPITSDEDSSQSDSDSDDNGDD